MGDKEEFFDDEEEIQEEVEEEEIEEEEIEEEDPRIGVLEAKIKELNEEIISLETIINDQEKELQELRSRKSTDFVGKEDLEKIIEEKDQKIGVLENRLKRFRRAKTPRGMSI